MICPSCRQTYLYLCMTKRQITSLSNLSILFLYFLVLGIFAGCTNKVVSGKSRLITPHQLKSMLDRNDFIKLVDVRTAEEVAKGRIANAVNIDYRDSNFIENISSLPKNAPYLIYCAKGSRSAAAMSKMKELGFTDLTDLQGGYIAWQKEIGSE